MDGVLVVDKPTGLTSHDVVAAARRVLGQPRIGHTGTLDPMATGVLPLACGRATRLVSLLTASEKEYLAGIRFGVATDSYDITGEETRRTDRAPDLDTVQTALRALSGEYLEPPPPVSAKKVGGRRAYELARSGTPVQPAPVPVRVALELLGFDGAVASVRVSSSPGFYVRALAHALGEHAGTGACLESLRRTRSGEFSLEGAVAMDRFGEGRDALLARMIPLERLLPRIPAVALTDDGEARIAHGRDVGAAHACDGWDPAWEGPGGLPAHVRLTTRGGALLALAEPGDAPGILHPAAVLR